MEATREMPKYKSHKEVWALKIKSIVRDGEGENRESDGSAIITPEEESYGPFRVEGDYLHKHKPQVGGYYVVYKDGYKSFSPAEAFEEGNTLISRVGIRHVEKAYNKLEKKMNADGSTMGLLNFIKIENKEDVKGVAPIVSFTIQSDPIGEVGINGCQALDMLKYVACLFESLNDAFPSSYNKTSLAHIENAIQAQNLRTADRITRSVEGQNKA